MAVDPLSKCHEGPHPRPGDAAVFEPLPEVLSCFASEKSSLYEDIQPLMTGVFERAAHPYFPREGKAHLGTVDDFTWKAVSQGGCEKGFGCVGKLDGVRDSECGFDQPMVEEGDPHF